MKVTIYTTTTCPFCNMQKDYFDEKGVEYEEKIVDIDEAAREEMMKVSEGYLGVPYTVVQKEDGKTETIIGFDKGRLNSILGLE